MLTLPEYAVCSLPWGILESPTPPLIRLFTGLDLSCGPRSHGENGLVTQKRLGVVLPLRLISYNWKDLTTKGGGGCVTTHFSFEYIDFVLSSLLCVVIAGMSAI